MLVFNFTFTDSLEDKGFFEKMFYSYRKQMVYLAWTYLQNQEDAEDTVHDVFLNIAQKHITVLKAIKNESDIRNYLLKATKNTAIDKIRNKSRKNNYFDTNAEFADNTDKLSDTDFLEQICNRLEYEDVLCAIKSLDSVYRESLYYHFVLEIPVSQTAKLLGQTVSATKKQLVRGKRMLLKKLEIKGE